MRASLVAVVLIVCVAPTSALGQDWPQWRGPNRDGRTSGFEAPQSWPEQLTKKWTISVGDGVASPSLVGDKLYVFARQEGQEVLRCLDASTGEELWSDQHDAEAVTGPASGFDGPRASPAVQEGKVVTLGAQGMLSCHNAETGQLLWRNDDNVGNVPRFATSSSPIVVAGLAITEFGGDESGGVVAYDLDTGQEAWRWTGSGASYGSPVQMTLEGVEAVVAPASDKLVVLAATDGSTLWEMPYSQGRYNSATPIVHDQTLILAGPGSGMTALDLSKEGDAYAIDEAWKNTENSVGFNTPVLKENRLYGISSLNSLFCINTTSGETAWNAPLAVNEPPRPDRGQGDRPRPRDGDRPREGDRPRDRDGAEQRPRGGDPSAQAQGEEQQEGRRRGRRGGRRGGRGGRGYGTVTDADSALLVLVPSGQLTVFAPGDEFTELAAYKVTEAGAYGYPVPSRHGLFIKDQDSITLWGFE